VQKLQEIAAEYEARGYEVLVEPGPEQLPEFLASFRPDLVARGPNESVVVEVKVGTQTAAAERFRDLAETIQRQPGWRFSLVVIDPRSDEVAPLTQELLHRKDIADRLGRAHALLKTGATDAAFLLMWVAVEAIPQKSPCACSLERQPPLTQLIELRLGLSQGPALQAETLAMRSKALPFLRQLLR